jgi:hypothetical protein
MILQAHPEAAGERTQPPPPALDTREALGQVKRHDGGLPPILRQASSSAPGAPSSEGAPAVTVTGQLPLHMALVHGASASVCLALLEHHSASATEVDSDGKLAIALAFEHGAAPSVSWALLVANPATARSKDASGRLAASAGTSAAKSALGMPTVERGEWLRPRVEAVMEARRAGRRE